MNETALKPGVQKAVNAILLAINNQRQYQGKTFGRNSKWATIVPHADYNIQIIPERTGRKGIDATVDDVRVALGVLEQTKAFDDYIRIEHKGGNAVLFDRGKGVPSNIKFD